MSTAKKKLTTCEPKTAVIYARYSSHSQRDVSIEQQIQDIRAYAEREGYTIIHEYADRAKSGFKNSERRAQFHAMLRDAESGAFDTVLAWKVDRFGRDRRESAMFKGQLADMGVSVVYAMEPIPDGAVGALTEGMLEAIAEWYSRNLSENVRRGKRDNAKKCMYNGVSIFGYDKGPDGKFVINEAEAAIVRRVFSLYAQGYSGGSIQKILTNDGIYTRNGYKFGITRLFYMITNESYIGTYHYEDIHIPGGMPAIIDKETFDICQELRAKTIKHLEKKEAPDFLLTGKCSCGFCHTNVRGNSGIGRHHKRYYYYSCGLQKSQGKDYCNLPSVKKERLEKDIVDFLCRTVLADELLDVFTNLISDTLKAQLDESPVRQQQKELADLNRRIENINLAISEGVWTKQTVTMLNNLSKQAEELEKTISYQKISDNQLISKERISFYLHKIEKGKRDDPDYLKSLVNVLINSITVYPEWLRIVINAQEHVEKIPLEELPDIDALPDMTRFDLCTVGSNRLYTVEPYPVIVFKIAI